MSDDSAEVDVEALLAHVSDRPLGDIPLRSRAALRPFSDALLLGATNLLDKALQALYSGDAERAGGLVRRAANLPDDELESVHPVLLAVQALMADALDDAVESGTAEDGDDPTGWLDAAVSALASGPGTGRLLMRDCLAALVQEWEIPALELRRVRTALAAAPEGPEVLDLDLTPEQRSAVVLQALETLVLFEDELSLGP